MGLKLEKKELALRYACNMEGMTAPNSSAKRTQKVAKQIYKWLKK